MKQESNKKNGGTERARVASRRLVYILEKAGIETSFFLYLFFIILDINLPPLVIIGKKTVDLFLFLWSVERNYLRGTFPITWIPFPLSFPWQPCGCRGMPVSQSINYTWGNFHTIYRHTVPTSPLQKLYVVYERPFTSLDCNRKHKKNVEGFRFVGCLYSEAIFWPIVRHGKQKWRTLCMAPAGIEPFASWFGNQKPYPLGPRLTGDPNDRPKIIISYSSR